MDLLYNELRWQKVWASWRRVKLPRLLKYVITLSVKTLNFNALKEQKSRARMLALRQARRSQKDAARIQRRVSLAGVGAKWRIANLNQVARAIAKWH
jgi:hypothetical protein